MTKNSFISKWYTAKKKARNEAREKKRENQSLQEGKQLLQDAEIVKFLKKYYSKTQFENKKVSPYPANQNTQKHVSKNTKKYTKKHTRENKRNILRVDLSSKDYNLSNNSKKNIERYIFKSRNPFHRSSKRKIAKLKERANSNTNDYKDTIVNDSVHFFIHNKVNTMPYEDLRNFINDTYIGYYIEKHKNIDRYMTNKTKDTITKTFIRRLNDLIHNKIKNNESKLISFIQHIKDYITKNQKSNKNEQITFIAFLKEFVEVYEAVKASSTSIEGDTYELNKYPNGAPNSSRNIPQNHPLTNPNNAFSGGPNIDFPNNPFSETS